VLGQWPPTSSGTRPRGCYTAASTTAPTRRSTNVLGPLTEDIPDFAATPEEPIASGDTVTVVAHYTAAGMATGKELDLRVMHVWDVMARSRGSGVRGHGEVPRGRAGQDRHQRTRLTDAGRERASGVSSLEPETPAKTDSESNFPQKRMCAHRSYRVDARARTGSAAAPASDDEQVCRSRLLASPPGAVRGASLPGALDRASQHAAAVPDFRNRF
jgi:hypothetical protein